MLVRCYISIFQFFNVNLIVFVRELIFCGEVVTTTLLDRCLKALPDCRFINLYSVSEAHDISCCDLTHWAQHNKVSHLNNTADDHELQRSSINCHMFLDYHPFYVLVAVFGPEVLFCW